MPYADPTRRREYQRLWQHETNTPERRAKNASHMRQLRASSPDFRARQAAATEKWRENLTPERKDELRERKARYARGRAGPDYSAKRSAQYFQREYGISVEGYDALLKSQDGKCALCDKCPETKAPRALYVDHDHETGRVRGLLCLGCNTMLGKVERIGLGRVGRYSQGAL